MFYLEDVAWAIIETNGRMSVIRKPEEDPVTPKQLGLKVPFPGLEVAVISDGELSRRSLALCGKEEAWVRRRLEERGLSESPGHETGPRGRFPAGLCLRVGGGPQLACSTVLRMYSATSSWLMPRAMASSPWRRFSAFLR